jgi:hypothetical protein
LSERDMQRLLDLVERVLGREWIDASEWLRSLPDNSVEKIEERLIAMDYAGLIVELDAAAKTFAASTHSMFERAGRLEAKWLDKQPQLAEKLVHFEAKNLEAVRTAELNELANVQGLTEETRANIQAALVDGTRTGANPRQVARGIRDSIGLTEQQGAWVRSYEDDLRSGRLSSALRRQLRDERSDKLLRRIQKDGGELTEKQVASLVERYRKKQLKYRAEMIARTEAARNVHAGSMESFRQAIERGDLKAEDLVREWHPGPKTKHAREDHRSSALLKQRPTWGEPYAMPNGAHMMYPGDEAGGASNVIHCRCTQSITLAAAA